MKTQLVKYANPQGVCGVIEFNLDNESDARKAFANVNGASECKVLSVTAFDDNPDNVTDDEFDAMLLKLSEASELEGSEPGELWASLVSLWESYQDYLTAPFRGAVRAEIARCAADIAKNYHIIEEEEEPAPKPRRTVKRLEYIG